MTESKLQSEIVKYSESNGYVATHFATAKCDCGSDVFELLMNEDEGVAARICVACEKEHGIGDSDTYFDDVEEVDEMQCTCDHKQFKIMAGVALYSDSQDVRWFYLGCECNQCGLAGVYGDWKNEYPNFQELLDNV